MLQRGHSRRDPKPRGSRRDWRSLLPDLEQMVPWPRGAGGPRTQTQVLANVLGYIQHLQRTLSIVRGGAGPPSDVTAAAGPSAGATQGQRLVPYEEEEEEEPEGGSSGPWLGLTGLDWEVPGWGQRGVPVSPPPRRGAETPLELSPSLLASPPSRGSPGEVVRALFPDVYLSPQAPAVAVSGIGGVGTPAGALRPGGPRGGRGRGAPPRIKKKCVNGFIMFCCLNRRRCMSVRPELSCTAVTRELARLWRSLRPDQRRPYCQRARRFNREHDRAMRPDRDGEGDGDPPALPLQLLAARAGQGPLSP